MSLAAVIAGITHWHAPRYVQYLRERGLRIVGASDADPAAGQAAAQRHGLHFEPDTDALLAATRPDVAVVLPRHDLAPAEIAAVAGRRVAMLVEKPMGRNAAEARRSAEAVHQAGVFATVCFPNRHLAIWQVWRELQAMDAVGTVMHAHFRTINGPPSRYVEYGVPWMLEPLRAGGGAWRNLGIHGADAALVLAGGRPLELVGGTTSRLGHSGDQEDFAAGVFATRDGFVATLEAGYTYANQQEGGDYEWRIAATQAYLHECNGVLRVHRRGHALVQRQVATPHEAYRDMVHAALDAFEAGTTPPASVDDCVRAVELQDRLYAAAHERLVGES
jgi:predicted dehydrogenase